MKSTIAGWTWPPTVSPAPWMRATPWRSLLRPRAFKFHLDMHLYKEDVHLYVLFAQRSSQAEQAEAVGVFTEALPRDRFGDFVAWRFPLVDSEDQARVIRVWSAAMPPPVFASSVGLVRHAIGDDYDELARRLPDLSSL
jgi:hypothetical protein